MTRTTAGALAPFAGLAAAFALSACATDGPPPEMTPEMACLHHHENNPEMRERCRLDPDQRQGPTPNMRAKDLPQRTGQMGD